MIRNRDVRITVVLAASIAFLMTGCGGGPKRPPVFRVTGKVLYKGNPVEGASVDFHNDKSPQVASGRTDKEGRFTLTTFSTGDGAVKGVHMVTVSKSVAVAGKTDMSVDKPSEDYGKAMQAASSGNMDDFYKNQLPSKYASRATTDLQKTVEEKANDFEIELTD